MSKAKKLISILLVLVMLLSVMPLTAFADGVSFAKVTNASRITEENTNEATYTATFTAAALVVLDFDTLQVGDTITGNYDAITGQSDVAIEIGGRNEYLNGEPYPYNAEDEFTFSANDLHTSVADGVFYMDSGVFTVYPYDDTQETNTWYVVTVENRVNWENETVRTVVLSGIAPTYYTVTWQDIDDTVLDTSLVAAGYVPTYNGETPTRPDEGYAQFTFLGWRDEDYTNYYGLSDDLPVVTGDVTYYTNYSVSFAEHTHNYTDYSIYWTWDGYTAATADMYCTICDECRTETATVTSESLSNRIDHTASVTVEGNTYTNTKHETITKQVSYIDANGDTQTVTATVLHGYESSEYYAYSATYFLGEEGQTTWYVVEDDIVYDDSLDAPIRIKGNVNLILADGASLTYDEISTPYTNNARSLSIYAQSAGTGTLTTDSITRYYQFDALNIYGGNINVDAIDRVSSVNIVSGTVDVGSLEANFITFGCRTVNDSISVDSYTVHESLDIADGQMLTDGTDDYSGNIVNASVLAGKTLRLKEPVVQTHNGYFLTLDNTIGVNFLIDAAYYGAEDGYIVYNYVASTTDGSAERVNVTKQISELPIYNESEEEYDGTYRLSLVAAPAQLAEQYIIEIYSKDGVLLDTLTASIAEYCKKLKDDATYGELLTALLDYGQLANEYFAYADKVEGEYEVPHSENYIAPLSAEEMATLQAAAVSRLTPGNAGIDGVAYIAHINPEFKFYFTGTSATTAEVSNGLQATVTKTEDGIAVKVTGLCPSDFATPFTVRVDGTTVTFNGYGYIRNALNDESLRELAQGLFRYAQAAENVFN